MKLQYLFYVIGIIFIFLTAAYFSYNYLFSLSDELKLILLVLAIIVFFALGEVFWEKNW